MPIGVPSIRTYAAGSIEHYAPYIPIAPCPAVFYPKTYNEEYFAEHRSVVLPNHRSGDKVLELR